MLKHLLRGGGSDLDGNSWIATLGGGRIEDGQSVAVGPDGSVYVGGSTSSLGKGYQVALLAKFNSSGALQWQKILLGDNFSGITSVAVGPDGFVYVCGAFRLAGKDVNNCLIAKFNSSGTLQWQKTLYKYDYDYSYGIAVGPDDSVYIGGRMSSATGQDIPDAVIAMFNASGTLRWQKTINYSGLLYIRSVAVGQDDSVYACGRAEVRGDLISPIWLIKVKDDIIAQSSSVYGEYTIENASFNNTNVSYGVSTLSLSLATSSLSVSTSSLTVEDINFTFNKYTGD